MRQSEIIKILEKHKKIGSLIDNACGELIGSGCHRDVYIFKHDDRWVIKIERDMSIANFANVCEWRNWVNHAPYKDFSKFLAPCLAIDETGRVLIQRRAKREIDGAKIVYPTHLPNWLTDTKKFNFGMIGKQFVCVDYSFLVPPAFRMRKAKYW